MTKANYDKLQRAVTMYANLTGESVDISEAKIDDPEAEAKEKAARAEEDLKARAKVDRELERAQQEARRIASNATKRDSEENPENKGPDQPATITERARAQGLKPAGK